MSALPPKADIPLSAVQCHFFSAWRGEELREGSEEERARRKRMHTDERGLVLTTSNTEAVEAYNEAVRDYLDYRLSAGDKAKRALAADPTFVMGQCLRGYFILLIGSNAVLPAAKKAGAGKSMLRFGLKARADARCGACGLV
jgi:hypothetical protein